MCSYIYIPYIKRICTYIPKGMDSSPKKHIIIQNRKVRLFEDASMKRKQLELHGPVIPNAKFRTRSTRRPPSSEKLREVAVEHVSPGKIPSF